MYCVDYQMSYPLLVVPYAPLNSIKKDTDTLCIGVFFYTAFFPNPFGYSLICCFFQCINEFLSILPFPLNCKL